MFPTPPIPPSQRASCARRATRNPVVDVDRPAINRYEGSTAAFDAPPADTLAGLRDRAILSVGLPVGFRRAEIAALNVGDLNQNRGFDAPRVKRRAAGTRRWRPTRRPRNASAPISEKPATASSSTRRCSGPCAVMPSLHPRGCRPPRRDLGRSCRRQRRCAEPARLVDPAEILMMPCYNLDLNGARTEGLRTAFVHRPDEGGPTGPPDPVPNPTTDIVGFGELADRLGACRPRGADARMPDQRGTVFSPDPTGCDRRTSRGRGSRG